MYTTYIIYFENFHRYYIGSTKNFEIRLKQHNSGKVQSTKGYRPWVLVYFETFISRAAAMSREYQLKSYKCGEAFKKLIKNDLLRRKSS